MSRWLRLGPPTITADEAQEKLGGAPPPIVLDVRTPQEFRSGHIRGARSVPLPDLPAALDALPRDRELVCVCASGSRSRRATSMLTRAGLYAVNLRGGMGAWTRAGLPVQRGGGDGSSRSKPGQKKKRR
ncbi:MAG: rhodanese-like domain-containing protein [Planctomycetaceae bacterium]